MNRRAVLRAVGAGVAIGLAGCSGNGNGGTGDGGDSSGGGSSGGAETATSTSTATATPTRTAEPTGTASPTPTQTPESQFSTEGNDSDLINKPAQELVITEEELPISGYSLEDEYEIDAADVRGGFDRTFVKGDKSQLDVRAVVCKNVQDCKKSFKNRNLNRFLGSKPDDYQTGTFDVAVECEFESGSIESNYFKLIRFRDANALAYMLWATSYKSELEKLANVAVTMHQKWR